LTAGIKANVDGSAAIQVGGVDAITLTSAGAASFVTSPMTIQGGSAAAPSLTFSGDTNTGIFSPAADTIAFSEGGVESMRIDASGNLGLGVTPSAWNGSSKVFQFGNNGTAAFENYAGLTNNMYYNGYRDSSNVARYVSTDRAARFGTSTNGGFNWEIAPSGTAGNAITFTQAMTLDASGRLLVGTTTARTQFTLKSGEAAAPTLGTASGAAFFGNSDVAYGMMFGTAGSGDGWIQQQRVDGTATAYNLWLQPSGGNVLVGLTSNSTGGPYRLNIFSASAVHIATETNTTSSFTHQRFINPNGIVGVISTSASTTSYVTSSDYRLKHDIQPMAGALAKVAALKPVTYKWNVDNSESQGFIAHELQAVVPECVTGEKDAVDADGNPVYQGIDTSFLVATLTAAIQELKAELDATKAEVALLKGAA